MQNAGLDAVEMKGKKGKGFEKVDHDVSLFVVCWSLHR
jgi:hypothetical protein